MTVVFYHSVIHRLAFYTCYIYRPKIVRIELNIELSALGTEMSATSACFLFTTQTSLSSNSHCRLNSFINVSTNGY